MYALLLPDEEPVVQELLVLRNQAVLPRALPIPTVTSTDALRYYDLAEALRDNIKKRVERAREHASARRAALAQGSRLLRLSRRRARRHDAGS